MWREGRHVYIYICIERNYLYIGSTYKFYSVVDYDSAAVWLGRVFISLVTCSRAMDARTRVQEGTTKVVHGLFRSCSSYTRRSPCVPPLFCFVLFFVVVVVVIYFAINRCCDDSFYTIVH